MSHDLLGLVGVGHILSSWCLDYQLTLSTSWLPLLFIPTNASPIFILLFFICTYFLNRPCVYCSFLLLILFASSCHWSDHCFFDFSSPNGFFMAPSPPTYITAVDAESCAAAASEAGRAMGEGNSTSVTKMVEEGMVYLSALNSTAAAKLINVARARGMPLVRQEWTGIGLGWLRSLLGRREWRISCLDVTVRL
jgi:hypothetical protein